MRWIVLALSLGVSVTSIIDGVFALLLSFPGKEAGGGGFSWLTGALLIFSALLALIGGLMAFNRRRRGGVFLIVSAVLCFFAHPTALVYGGLYLAGGFTALLLRPNGRYDEYDYDDEDNSEDEREGEDEEEPVARPRRRESPARIAKPVEPPLSISEDFGVGDHKVRVRKSKTCPTCGATAAIHHKFCPNCGARLHIPSHAVDLQEPDEADAPQLLPEAAEREDPDRKEETRTSAPDAPLPEPNEGVEAFAAFAASAPTEDPLEERKRVFVKPRAVLGDDLPPLAESDEGKVADEPEEAERLDDSAGEDDPPEDRKTPEPLPAHKVFVTPLRDELPPPHRSVNIGPDSSYAEFSQYSRRRKRRPRSLVRRLFGIGFLLAIVGGAAWFLLGLRKLPKDALPVPPPSLPTEREIPALPSGDIFAEPLKARGGADLFQNFITTDELPKRGIVLGSSVNLREEHSTHSKSVARMNTGVGADILEQWEGVSGTLSGVWYRVRTVAKKEGWVYGTYFLPLKDSPLPEGYTAALMEPFGLTKADAIAKLGQPARSAAASLSWAGISLALKADQVVRIQVSDARHPLANGVVVGMTDKELYRTMGYPSNYNSGQLRYRETDKAGVLVRLKNGRVQSVSLDKPAQ